MDETSSFKNGEKRRKFRSDDDDINNGSSDSNGEKEDRLSSLPDALLVDNMLSLLPIKSAAVTSALSRRWRRLWTQLTCLRFSPFSLPIRRTSNCSDDFCKFCTTIDLILRQFPSTNLRSFNLYYPYSVSMNQWNSCCSCVESWIQDICDGRNVEELAVSISRPKSSPLFQFPSCVFECESLKLLEFSNGFRLNCKLPDDGVISLPNLKKLKMYAYDSDCELMRTLFKSCPLLEDLGLSVDFMENEHVVTISAQCLKELSLDMEKPSRECEFVVDAPNLEDIRFYGYRSSFFRITKSLSGLREAFILMFSEKDGNEQGDDYVERTLELVHGVSSVRSLYLLLPLFKSLENLGVDDGVLPVFHNLTYLAAFDCWKPFLRFVKCFPNLEDLSLKNLDPAIEEDLPLSLPACLLSKLKRIDVSELSGNNRELKFLKYILSKCIILEELHVFLKDNGRRELSEEFKFCKNRFSHPRSSVKCEVKFHGRCLVSSSKGLKFGLLDCQIYWSV